MEPLGTSPIKPDAETDGRVLQSIAEAIESLDYGSVTITVHAAKVVQLDITRKQRFHTPS